MRFPNLRGRGPWPLPRIALAVGVLALPLAGCDTEELLEVEDPEFATPGSLDNPAALPTVVAGALSDFQIGYSGDGDDSFLAVNALITDEFYSSGTFTTRTVTDQRDQFPAASGNTSDDAFEFLQLARQSLNTAASAVVRLSEDGATDPRIALLRGLEGYTYVALAEGFCSNIPFSDVVGGVPADEAGMPLSTEQVFDSAVSVFNSALAANAASNLAAVGKARALLNLGRYPEAAAAVASVPTDFVYFIEHSSNDDRQYNPIFALQDNGRYSVSDNEGGNGLPFRSALDPRVPWAGPVPGFDATIPQFIDLRYTSFDSDVPLADGIEARLIEAEAALQAGDNATYLAKLNELRADVMALMADRYDNYDAIIAGLQADTTGFGELEPLADPGSQEARIDLLFSERGFWLYNTGHRLGDLRRLVRVYGRSADDVFPTGDYFKGGEYGPDVTFPIPFNEVNNTNYDPALCDVTQA